MALILVAEDDDITRDLVRRALETDGHKVSVASDGREALDLAEAGQTFDLVVTDVDMPSLDGVSLAEALLARDPASASLSCRPLRMSWDGRVRLRSAASGSLPSRSRWRPFEARRLRFFG